MFKPELWQSHDEYRTIITTIGRRLSRNNPKYSFNEYDAERQKLLNLNLDPLLDYIPGFYSQSGRPAKHQAQILRSLILLSCFLIKPKPAQALLYGYVKSFPTPFPWLFLLAAPLWMNCRPSALIMIS